MTRAFAVLGAAAIASGLGACSPEYRPIFSGGDGTSAPVHGDSVLATALRLVGHVSLIDSVGRVRGTLPQRLEEAVPPGWLRDVFGNPLEYSTAGPEFTVRSAGRDGMQATADDILVTGRLGRSVPCELRMQDVIDRYEETAPLCSEGPVVVLPECPGAEFHPVPGIGRGADPVGATGERLAYIARRVDGRGRAIGALPSVERLPSLEREDAWGRPIRYRVAGHRFELRSAGPDGRPDTGDDIVVDGELGGIIACEFTNGSERVRCVDPLPQCPRAGEPLRVIGAGPPSSVPDPRERPAARVAGGGLRPAHPQRH